MAKSTVIVVRLQDAEIKMLEKIKKSSDRGAFNTSELIRLLIHREFLRRTTGKSKVDDSDVLSDIRIGRPVAQVKMLLGDKPGTDSSRKESGSKKGK